MRRFIAALGLAEQPIYPKPVKRAATRHRRHWLAMRGVTNDCRVLLVTDGGSGFLSRIRGLTCVLDLALAIGASAPHLATGPVSADLSVADGPLTVAERQLGSEGGKVTEPDLSVASSIPEATHNARWFAGSEHSYLGSACPNLCPMPQTRAACRCQIRHLARARLPVQRKWPLSKREHGEHQTTD